jgi:hypothetical protein
MESETLDCRAGHTFARIRVRGRKPTACPAHGGKILEERPRPVVDSSIVDVDSDNAEEIDREYNVPISGTERAGNLMIMLDSLPKTRTVILHSNSSDLRPVRR